MFLYSELAGYSIACIRALAALNKGRIAVVHWPVNPTAPFQLNRLEGVEFYDKSDKNWRSILESNSWDLVVVSGWIDKDYIGAIRSNRNFVLVGIDTPWDGSLKQKLRTKVGKYLMAGYFNAAWVAGEPQARLAREMGLNEVIDGVYSADDKLFAPLYVPRSETAKAFAYIGRYSNEKGIKLLWEAFDCYRREGGNYDLHCAGIGPMYDQRPMDIEGLYHHGFLQPSELPQLLDQTSAFILPSTYEPWGVVVHEMAMAGQLIVASEAVHSTRKFVVEGSNGLTVKPGNREDLVRAMHEISSWDHSEIEKGRQQSNNLGLSYTTEDWAMKLLTIGQCAE